MGTMQDYTIFCTEEQTRRACKLGAPIETVCTCESIHEYQVQQGVFIVAPTTQQMIGWLREKGVFITISTQSGEDGYIFKYKIYVLEDDVWYPCHVDIARHYEQAELAAIDAALDYLEKGGTNDD